MARRAFISTLCLGWLLSVARSSNTTGLLSIPPSLYFDGVDGAWSTFHVQVGTPGQTVRLLPGTSASAGDTIWVVIPQGCSEANPNLTDCAGERGYTFTSNQSSSWSTQRLQNGGLFALNTFEEGGLGLTGNAYYGFDTIELGIDGSGMPTLDAQLVAGIATNNYWLGSLGLSPIPFNFTTLNSPIPSMLSTLRNQSTIASLSWAYTAGASYRDPPVYGSLTLGGYDNARFNSSAALSGVPFGADFSRDLLIGIQSITFDALGSSPLLSQGIYAFIDSMVTSMYLPLVVCQAFEQAFNLTWNATNDLYLLSGTQHAALLAQNPTFKFTLGLQAKARGRTVDITIPYSAFDLNISQPYVSEESYYFPLKRATNDSQYTLGRVFLQEAYVVADYDRHQFQVAQALFPSTEAQQQLQVLQPPNSTNPSTPGPTPSPGLSTGAIAGIVIGVVVVAVALLGIWLYYRRKRQHSSAAPPDQGSDPASRYPDEKKEDMVQLAPNQADPYAELSAHDAGRHEMSGRSRLPAELGSKVHGHGHELPAGSAAAEMDGRGPVTELDGRSYAPVELEAPLK